ncbi:MAG: hypothetical protein EOP51_10340 [Sphingobacteriales bacterium]|nr:MAG: hypothetical protein EOP51_10340 [Sphingobacteriales bacterium]
MKKILLAIFSVTSCAAFAQEVNITGPKLVVYKTKGDYSNMVPVGLSEDKSRIVSYPAPTDIKVAGGYLKPSKLAKGYLLDNQGIGKNVAFLNISYEAYAKMDQLSRDELYTKIADKDPLVELYDCGQRNAKLSSLIKALKKDIRKKRLSNCNKLK